MRIKILENKKGAVEMTPKFLLFTIFAISIAFIFLLVGVKIYGLIQGNPVDQSNFVRIGDNYNNLLKDKSLTIDFNSITLLDNQALLFFAKDSDVIKITHNVGSFWSWLFSDERIEMEAYASITDEIQIAKPSRCKGKDCMCFCELFCDSENCESDFKKLDCKESICREISNFDYDSDGVSTVFLKTGGGFLTSKVAYDIPFTTEGGYPFINIARLSELETKFVSDEELTEDFDHTIYLEKFSGKIYPCNSKVYHNKGTCAAGRRISQLVQQVIQKIERSFDNAE